MASFEGFFGSPSKAPEPEPEPDPEPIGARALGSALAPRVMSELVNEFRLAVDRITQTLPTATSDAELGELEEIFRQAQDDIARRRDEIRCEAAAAELLRARADAAERSALRLPNGQTFSFSFEADFGAYGGEVETSQENYYNAGLAGSATLTVTFGSSRMACRLRLAGGEDDETCEWTWNPHQELETFDWKAGGFVEVQLFSPGGDSDEIKDEWLGTFPEAGPLDVSTSGLVWSGHYTIEQDSRADHECAEQTGPPALTGVPTFRLDFTGEPQFRPASIAHVSSCIALWVLSHAASSGESLGLTAAEVVAHVGAFLDSIFDEAWATVARESSSSHDGLAFFGWHAQRVRLARG